MLKKFLLIVFVNFFLYSTITCQEMKTTGKIHREDPAINKLISDDAVIEILAEGFGWSEGPVWIKDVGYVLFTDVPKNSIYKWKEKEGLSLFLRPSGFALGDKYAGGDIGSNGLFVNPLNGQLVLCDHGNRCLTELNRKNWTKKIIIDCI